MTANDRKLKIAYIAAGAAGMYCGSCARDNALATALIRKGHEVALIPTYTPLRTDEPGASIDRVFFNGINVYLQQKLPFLRKGNRLLEGIFESRRMVNWIAKANASTNAKDLGELTISMLKGEAGNQRHELEKLVAWLKDEYRPEIVQITNSMMIGMAREIKRALDVPVLCVLQGEDIFLDDLAEPYKSRAMALLRERIGDADGLIATSRFYADYMAEYLAVEREKIHPVRIGINPAGHGLADPTAVEAPFVIGYLARICPEKGLHLLVEAFRRLAARAKPGDFRLRIAGYLGARDRAYFEEIRRNVTEWGLAGQVDFVGEVDREEKIAFLNSLHVLSVPTVYREPKGLFLLEALANGVPVIQPAHGAFPELIEATGGGMLVAPDNPDAIAEAVLELRNDPMQRQQLGRQGKAAVHRDFTHEAMAEETLQVFRKYVGRIKDEG